MAAARPSPGDARVPCPMCGGLIHPIAGKCKHCKGDLAGLRSARPAASVTLPSIIATNGTPLNPPTNGHANGHNGHANGHNGHNGHRSYAPIPTAAQHVALPMQLARQQYETHNEILPPRPTGRMQAESPHASWWKSWPLIVIVLAVLAIVTAVVLMVWPPGKPAGAGAGADDHGEMIKSNKAIPAPERMETNPLPPKDQPPAPRGDPWDDSNRPGAKIDIPDDPDDTLGGGGGFGGGGGLGGGPGLGGFGKSVLSGRNAVMMEIPLRLCERAKACGNVGQDLEMTCQATKLALGNFDLSPPSCAARSRCLGHIDALDCGDFEFDVNSATKLMTSVQACVEALTNC